MLHIMVKKKVSEHCDYDTIQAGVLPGRFIRLTMNRKKVRKKVSEHCDYDTIQAGVLPGRFIRLTMNRKKKKSRSTTWAFYTINNELKKVRKKVSEHCDYDTIQAGVLPGRFIRLTMNRKKVRKKEHCDYDTIQAGVLPGRFIRLTMN
ncbi:hypothetical protein BY458DRAFT_493156 [Sporodiniella umbellata]|nr:hypothetical protein BY458DRAFT_493156 [Sporodiniella umbellata]